MEKRPSSPVDTDNPFFPVLLLLFVGSGCAALIYEVVWFQLLQLVIGSSAVSLGVLLGTFMGGMCLGSFVLPRYIDRAPPPAARLRRARARHRRDGPAAALSGCRSSTASTRRIGGGPVALRAIVAGDLPAAADAADGRDAAGDRALGRDDAAGVSWLGLLLRRQHRRRRARQPARRLLPAARVRHGDRDLRRRGAQRRSSRSSRLLIAKVTPHEPSAWLTAGTFERAPERGSRLRRDRAVRPDGACLRGHLDAPAVAALRRDGLHVLADSRRLSLRARHRQQPRRGHRAQHRTSARRRSGWCQMLLCGAMAWAAYMLTSRCRTGRSTRRLRRDPWFNFQLDIVRCLWVVLPGAILWGASFPLALAAVAAPGRIRGDSSAASTRRTRSAPSSDRSAPASSWWSSSARQRAQQVLIVLSAISGLMLLAPAMTGASDAARSAGR